ncbi:MAG: TasA family protein [Clostridia bacterium]|nr:TasA family protein [Clostridia bacterium]MDY2928765.1 TasA family protein [Clostridiaceae bacterium]
MLTSVLSIALCLSMLIGTTFAWFTDTASTAVNKIQAGTLDVDIVDAAGNTLNGKTLYFRDKDQNTNILWEPGATFNLDTFRIVNKGNLALKYKVVISGIDGSAELLNVINFTVKKGEEAPVELAGWEGVLLPEGAAPAAGADVKTTGVIAISGKMDEQAGNQYQGLSIDGLGITVYATQSQYESDSKDNTYDAGADMTPDNLDKMVVANVTKTALKDEETILTAEGVTARVPANSVGEGTDLTLTVTPSTEHNVEITTDQNAQSYEVKLVDQNGNDVTLSDGKFVTVTLNVGKNLGILKFLHNDTELTPVSGISGEGQYFYDAGTGILTFSTSSFSPFTAVYTVSNGTEAHPYQIFTAEQALAMENGKGYYKLMADIVVPDEIYMSRKAYTVDLNGHSITLKYDDTKFKPNNGGVFNISGKNGKLTINDSSADQSGKVIGSDKTYPNKVTSAVRVGNYGKLTINGGHFYGTSEGTSCIFVMTSMSSGSKATVTINGGRFETATPSNGTYFVLNHQDSATTGCTITVKGGSFKNYNPGVTSVDPVNAYTGKIALGTGCTTTATADGSDTWYTVSK